MGKIRRLEDIFSQSEKIVLGVLGEGGGFRRSSERFADCAGGEGCFAKRLGPQVGRWKRDGDSACGRVIRLPCRSKIQYRIPLLWLPFHASPSDFYIEFC